MTEENTLWDFIIEFHFKNLGMLYKDDYFYLQGNSKKTQQYGAFTQPLSFEWDKLLF